MKDLIPSTPSAVSSSSGCPDELALAAANGVSPDRLDRRPMAEILADELELTRLELCSLENRVAQHLSDDDCRRLSARHRRINAVLHDLARGRSVGA